MERRLAAVLVADVVGYSRLSRVDEEGTRARFTGDLEAVFKPAFAAHNGRLVKTMGDGILVEFRSVVDALRCAVVVQREKAKRNAGVAPEQRMEFRIGINLGDILVEGDDIQGDGVNVAARMQTLAEPGGIAVSGTTYDQIGTRLPFHFVSLGPQVVKSIDEPVRVYRLVLHLGEAAAGSAAVGGPAATAIPAEAAPAAASPGHPAAAPGSNMPGSAAPGSNMPGSSASVRRRRLAAAAAVVAAVALVAAGAAWWARPPAPTALAPTPERAAATGEAALKPSLVVMPFHDIGSDVEQGYLADGFTDDLTTELARIPGLFVVSHEAAVASHGAAASPTETARRLGVRFLLVGSLRRIGDDMRINVQLIDGESAVSIWAERFDDSWTNVFALQDRVVADIAEALRLRLVSGQGKVDYSGGTSDPAAYEAFLRGIELSDRNTVADVVAAEAQFRQALRLDPQFGAAMAELAWLYYDADDARAEALGLVGWDAARAKIEPLLIGAAAHPSPSYYQLAASLAVREHRAGEAVELLQKALPLDPSEPWTYLGLAEAFAADGQPKEARSYLEAAMRVDPGWSDWRRYLAAVADFGLGRFADAVAKLQKIDLTGIDPWPKFFGLQLLVASHGQLGTSGKALDDARAALAQLVAARGEGAPTQLLTQRFLVFSNEADIMRVLDGLAKAGIPALPAGVDLDPADRLTGAEIRAEILGRDLVGRSITDGEDAYARTSSNSGITVTIGDRQYVGKSWVQGDFLCNSYPLDQTNCGAIFRNPKGSAAGHDSYIGIYPRSRYEFSIAP